MRPREFDELLKQKFDRNDFEYSPKNWAQLEEQLDSKPGKRNIMLWLPMAVVASVTSIAASLAMIISIPVFQHHTTTHPIAVTAAQPHPVQIASVQVTKTIAPSTIINNKPAHTELINNKKSETPHETTHQPLIADATPVAASISALPAEKIIRANKKMLYNAYLTYNAGDDESKKKEKITISFSAGANYSNAMSGYTIGATGKKMLSEKLYIESDIAIVRNNTTERTEYYIQETMPAVMTGGKMTSANTKGVPNIPSVTKTIAEYRQNNYDLYYAQVTPTVGYNILKRMSVGVGADVQHILVNNRPDMTMADNTGLKEIPSFDLGLVGKTECTISKKVKAGFYYRQELNNVINPGNKYIDRTYLQFSLKYLIRK